MMIKGHHASGTVDSHGIVRNQGLIEVILKIRQIGCASKSYNNLLGGRILSYKSLGIGCSVVEVLDQGRTVRWGFASGRICR